ncbi:S8 family peptidase [Rhizobium ruizarguesonis]|uniref:S8 family peptidase n=1 Tax=Rhizobium ruizarguesonis TaxID=2081791 RepID=UPI0016AB98B5|nr:S8 family serine peptidase [Rhizobium ruizarguesonis]
MAEYVLVNRRAGKFSDEAKISSRASVASAMAMVMPSSVVRDHAPEDKLARRVVILDLDEAAATDLRSQLSSSDAILEPLIRRKLHHRRPAELQAAMPFQARADVNGSKYQVKIVGGGNPLSDIEVMFYIADPSGSISTVIQRTDKNGDVSAGLAPGQRVAFVEPIPYSGFWIMLSEAPAAGALIDCTPISDAPKDGIGWWHVVTNTGDRQAGAGIKVGVIDTGCGPHRNLAHVTLAGVFTGGQILPAAGATDVAEHGTHTTGLIGARPTRPGDYSGMAPETTLFHARVFASEEQGPSQADLINAIDSLSRDHQCDLINMSLGGGPPSPAEQDCIRDALERGTLCICSAGNDAGPVNYPAAYPECVSVSALGQVGWAPAGTFSAGNRPREAGKLGKFNLFLASFSSNGQGLDAAGPGVGIVSTVPEHDGNSGPYMEMDGTSMASPAVCGTLTAILSKDPHYVTYNRDISRANAARQLLEAHCMSLGLSRSFQGLGLPIAGQLDAQLLGDNSPRQKTKRKTSG